MYNMHSVFKQELPANNLITVEIYIAEP